MEVSSEYHEHNAERLQELAQKQGGDTKTIAICALSQAILALAVVIEDGFALLAKTINEKK